MRRIFLLPCLLCATATVATAQPKLELVLQTGHTGAVRSVCLSADGRRALTGSDDNTAILWDATTGEKLVALKGHTSAVTSVSLSGDGNLALTGSQDRVAIVWDIKTGTHTALKGHSDIVISVSLSQDGQRVLTGSQDKSAILWDAKTGQKLLTLSGHTKAVHGVALSKDGGLALTNSADATAILWDATTGRKLFTHKQTGFSSVSLSPDGSRMLTSFSKTLNLFDTKTGERIQAVSNAAYSTTRVSLSIDANMALTCDSFYNTAYIWDIKATNKRIHTLTAHTAPVLCVSLSEDGSRALTGSSDQTAIVWDAKAGKPLVTLQGQMAAATSVSANKVGQILTGSADGTAVLWDTATGMPAHTFTSTNRNAVTSVRLSQDGNRAFTGATGASLLWDAKSGKQLFALAGGSGGTMSADGSRALTESGKNLMLFWNAATGNRLQAMITPNVTSISLSQDGGRALTGGPGPAIVWDGKSGEKMRTVFIPKITITAVSLSEDGSRALIGFSDKTAILWDAKSGEKLQTLSGHTNGISVMTLGEDRALTGSQDGTVILWDTKAGKKLHLLSGHAGRVTGVSLNGERVLTTSIDGTTRVWDAKTGKELCRLLSMDRGKEWLVVTPDGYYDGSVNATKVVSFQHAGTQEFVPLERYRRQFERPGLLAMVWKGEDYRGKPAVEQELPPTVRITSPKDGFVSKDGKFTITAEAQNRGTLPVTAFRLKVNGKPHVKKQGIFDVASPKTGKVTANWDIELDPGRHEVEVLAYTKAVFNVSDPVALKYVGGQQEKVELPTLHVLAVGISKYPNKDHQLDFAHKDAQEITRAFQKHSTPLFKKIEVTLLSDDKATRKAILQGLSSLRKNATAKDYTVFFFAGHGVKDNRDKFYLFPVDGDRDDLSSTAISDSIITEELISIPGQLLVLLDACHAGAVVNKTRSLRGMTEELLKDLSSEEKGVAIMCSATGKELAQESREHGHGMFTLALLEAIRGSGSGEMKVRLNNGAVYFKELDAFVNGRVRQLSKNQQHPVTGTPRTFRDFPVSKPQ